MYLIFVLNFTNIKELTFLSRFVLFPKRCTFRIVSDEGNIGDVTS